MATQLDLRRLQLNIALEIEKANDLEFLISSLNNRSSSDTETINLIKQYYDSNQHDIQRQIQTYTLSKVQLIQSTNNEIDRLRIQS